MHAHAHARVHAHTHTHTHTLTIHSSNDATEVRGATVTVVGACDFEVVWMISHSGTLEDACLAGVGVDTDVSHRRSLSIPHSIFISSNIKWIIQRVQINYKCDILADPHWLLCAYLVLYHWINN